MNLHKWLDGETGRSKWLAEQLGVSRTAVSLWRDNGVPMEHWPRIVDLTDSAVHVLDLAEHAMNARQASAAQRSAAKAA